MRFVFRFAKTQSAGPSDPEHLACHVMYPGFPLLIFQFFPLKKQYFDGKVRCWVKNTVK